MIRKAGSIFFFASAMFVSVVVFITKFKSHDVEGVFASVVLVLVLMILAVALLSCAEWKP